MGVQQRMEVLLSEAADDSKKLAEVLASLGAMTSVVLASLERAKKQASMGSEASKADLPFLADLAELLQKHKKNYFLHP